jgi:hypothetical protein
MARGDISWSGQVLRAVLWRAPVRATQYTVAGYMATAQEVGRRWISLAGLGAWVWFLWWAAGMSGVQGFQELVAFLLLLWVWRLIVLVRWTISLRVAAARARAQQRLMLETLTQLPGQMQQLARQAIPGGTFTVGGMLRHHDPHAEEQQRQVREQAEQVRGWLPAEHRDMPLGDLEPLVRMPRWMRRRKPKEGDE